MPTRQVQAWAEHVLERLKERFDLSKDHFVLLAGQKYRKFLVPRFASYEVPMQGLTIGRQLQFLSGREKWPRKFEQRDKWKLRA